MKFFLLVIIIFGAIWTFIIAIKPPLLTNSLSKKQINFISIIFAFIASLSIITVTIVLPYYNQISENKQRALSGRILTNKINTNRDRTIIWLGSNRISVPSRMFNNNKKFNPTKLFHFDFPIEIWQEESGIKINTTITSIDKKVVAIINRNEWEINPGNYFTRNYDESGLEIIDAFNLPVLQVNLLNSNEIYFGGIFLKDLSYTIIDRDSGFVIINGEYQLEEVIKKSEHIKKLFKYPSDTHLGIRN